MIKENRTEVCCSLPPGTATVLWRGDRIVAVRLGRRSLAGPTDNGACHALLAALDHGAAAAGLQYDLGSVPEFTRKVLRLCGRIPSGAVRTYGQLARMAGRPGAARSVGQAMAANPLPLIIPCHRVVRSEGFIGGYTGGTAWKEFLLGREGWTLTGRGRSRRLADWPGSRQDRERNPNDGTGRSGQVRSQRPKAKAESEESPKPRCFCRGEAIDE